MFDIAPTELLLVAVVALVVIGPKDLPKAMRLVGRWVGRARGMARQFRSGFDEMVRESELAEMQKQWAAENERIMREHPPAPALPAPMAALGEAAAPPPAEDAGPVMVEQPAMRSASAPEPPAAPAPAPKPRRRKPPAAAAEEGSETPGKPKPRPRRRAAPKDGTDGAPQ